MHGVDRGLKSFTGTEAGFELQRLAGPALLKLLERLCALPAAAMPPNAPAPRIVVELPAGQRVLLLEGGQLRFADSGQRVGPATAVAQLATSR